MVASALEDMFISWAPTQENATTIESAPQARLELTATFRTRTAAFSISARSSAVSVASRLSLANQSSRLADRNFDSRSATCTLFRSDIGKCVLPRMPDRRQLHERDVAAVLVHHVTPQPGGRTKDAPLLLPRIRAGLLRDVVPVINDDRNLGELHEV